MGWLQFRWQKVLPGKREQRLCLPGNETVRLSERTWRMHRDTTHQQQEGEQMWSVVSVPRWRTAVLSLRCGTWWRGCRGHGAWTSDRSWLCLEERRRRDWNEPRLSVLLILHRKRFQAAPWHSLHLLRFRDPSNCTKLNWCWKQWNWRRALKWDGKV